MNVATHKLVNIAQQSITSPQKERSSQVAIVIAGRNSEAFLAEAIESALNQSIPCEVVYADDCSFDSSLTLANQYINRGLLVLPSGTHLGVCATRNRGADSTSAPYIIFLDTDDRLPKDYVQLLLSDMNPSVPFVYPSTKCFGSSTTLWKNLEWNKYDKWCQNQVSTTALWNRAIFNAVGKWQDLPTMWDYDLAIRCSRYGTPVAGKATLDYRIHENSQSALLDERFQAASIPYRELIRRKLATLGIGSLVSGRLPELFPLWMSRLACSVRYMNSTIDLRFQKERTKLLLLLHTKAQEQIAFYQREAIKYSDTFNIQFSCINDQISYKSEQTRRIDVSTLLANACNQIQSTLMTDHVWLIEDDIVIPMRAYEELSLALTQGATPPTGVSAVYYNRHPGLEHKQLGGWIREGQRYEPAVHFRELDAVDFVGTGCLMYWRDRPTTPKKWQPFTTKYEPGTTAHDWAWSEQVQQLGGELLIVGTVNCDHHISLTDKV